jgi:hypothetical protein
MEQKTTLDEIIKSNYEKIEELKKTWNKSFSNKI